MPTTIRKRMSDRTLLLCWTNAGKKLHLTYSDWCVTLCRRDWTTLLPNNGTRFTGGRAYLQTPDDLCAHCADAVATSSHFGFLAAIVDNVRARKWPTRARRVA